jgi:hypothetical protein
MTLGLKLGLALGPSAREGEAEEESGAPTVGLPLESTDSGLLVMEGDSAGLSLGLSLESTTGLPEEGRDSVGDNDGLKVGLVGLTLGLRVSPSLDGGLVGISGGDSVGDTVGDSDKNLLGGVVG